MPNAKNSSSSKGKGRGLKLNAEKGLKILEELWNEVENINVEDLDKDKMKFVDENLVKKIRSIIRGRTVSFRYALLTQLLAKIVEPNVNALALQAKASMLGIKGAFNARSFCKKTIVKFEETRLENILGGSNDPYVYNPLRRPLISLDVIGEIKDKKGWRALYEILSEVENKKDIELARRVLKQALLEIRKLQVEVIINLSSKLPVSKSPTIIELKNVISNFLDTPSEGARPQAIVYALLRVVNKRVKAFKEVRSAKSTVPDKMAGMMADIECVGEDGSVRVAVSVTEHLDDEKLREELDKGIQRKIAKLIITAWEINLSQDALEFLEKRMKQQEIDIIIMRLIEFIEVFLMLLNGNMRKEFILEIIEVLKELGYINHLKDWIEILREAKLVR